jgi:hypothetical protein
MNFIPRDTSRTESDDWLLNVQPRLGPYTEALPVTQQGVVVGWKIQSRYE